MNEKERLLKVLAGEKVDRQPVICPGGMMNAAVTELLNDVRINHNTNLDDMVATAIKVREITGFENYGLPFCMTCEAEPFGVEISEGDIYCEPRIIKYNEAELNDIMDKYRDNSSNMGRCKIVLQAIEKLKNNEIPVIGNITGPISTATSIVDPLKLFKMLRKNPDIAYEFIDYVNDYLIVYAKNMIAAGADVVAISDPTATGEILGRNNFEKFVMPMYRKFLSAMKKLDTPVIIHICGDARKILESLNDLQVQALSFDSIVNMRFARVRLRTRLMGNVSTLLLQNGPVDRIVSITENAMDSGVDIVSPACGLGMSTPLKHLQAMTTYVKESALCR